MKSSSSSSSLLWPTSSALCRDHWVDRFTILKAPHPTGQPARLGRSSRSNTSTPSTTSRPSSRLQPPKRQHQALVPDDKPPTSSVAPGEQDKSSAPVESQHKALVPKETHLAPLHQAPQITARQTNLRLSERSPNPQRCRYRRFSLCLTPSTLTKTTFRGLQSFA